MIYKSQNTYLSYLDDHLHSIGLNFVVRPPIIIFNIQGLCFYDHFKTLSLFDLILSQYKILVSLFLHLITWIFFVMIDAGPIT